MTLFEKHRSLLERAVDAVRNRVYFSAYPESPKAYAESAAAEAQAQFEQMKGQRFTGLEHPDCLRWHGEEISPFTKQALRILYPLHSADQLTEASQQAWRQWRRTPVNDRVGLLLESLEQLKTYFFEMALATQHTSGQSWLMSFQASGPHAADRALEAVAMGYWMQHQFAEEALWEKPVGKTTVRLRKKYQPVPLGIGLVIGCSTFPVWNSLPGIYASLVTGNSVLVKPHPRAVLPIALVVRCLQQTFAAHGYPPHTILLAGDDSQQPITQTLAAHPSVRIIDYTGGSAFGDWIESLPNKICYTEKTGVNSVLLHSADDWDAVLQNLAFSLSLYSGQMCTAPQNIFVPEQLLSNGQPISRQAIIQKLRQHIQKLLEDPKAAAGILGAIQSQATVERVEQFSRITQSEPLRVAHGEFPSADAFHPLIMEVGVDQSDRYTYEWFGPMAFIIPVADVHEGLERAKGLARERGALTCLAYTIDTQLMKQIAEEMNEVFVPVTFNLKGPIWVNQHAAFSDFHGTGGNAAGTACYVDATFIVRRFVWVGNRMLD